MKKRSATHTEQLTQKVKEVAKQWGAALVGVAPIERFDPMPPYYDRAPKGHDPREMLSTARSVISVAQPIMNPVVDAPALLMDGELEMVPPDAKNAYLERMYLITGHRVQDYMLEFVGQMVGQLLMGEDFQAMIFPTTSFEVAVDGLTQREVWEGPNEKWAEQYSPFGYRYGPLSHRHAATRAGLGEFGYINVVLTKEFGARQRFNTIVTDAELVPDPLISKPICLREKCRLCLEACPVDAITLRDDPEGDDYRTVEQVDNDVVFIDTPARTKAPMCDRRKDRMVNPPVYGECLRVCPLPTLSSHNLPERLRKITDEWRAKSKSE